MSLRRPEITKLQWFAALLILCAAFFGPHLRLPASSTFHPNLSSSVAPSTSIDTLFVSNSAASELSYRIRDVLLDRYGDIYSKSPYFDSRMLAATTPDFSNFNNFLLSPTELLIHFPSGQVAPGIEGDVSVSLPIQSLLASLRPEIVADYLPSHKQSYRTARQEYIAQIAARSAVNEDRSNINCALMKCVALTFDDGPDGEKGRRIIQALKERRAVGTFFVVGSRLVANSQEVKDAAANGNEIGNHTWNHPQLTRLAPSAVSEQVSAADVAIEKVIGKKPTLFRPPYGLVNNQTIQAINRPIALWNVDTRDWLDRDAGTITTHALGKVHPGAVVLFHSIYDSTADAMPRIIDQLQSRGYVLVTMSELYGITDENQSQFTNKKLYGR